MALWSRLTSGIAGFGVGAATADAVTPELEPLKQTAWRNHPSRVLDAGSAAEVAAEELATPVDLADDAARTGLGPARFALLTELARVGPEADVLLSLWRRRLIGEAAVDEGLAKLRVKREYRAGLKELKQVRLTPADIANAIQQGFIPGDGILPGAAGGSPPYSIPVDVVPIDPELEAEAAGVDRDRLTVLAQLVGLPPGPMQLLEMWNRNIIDEESVDHGVREGHTKTKWLEALKQLRHRILSPAEAAELRLRGWIDQAESHRLGALSGASPEVMDRLYQNRGRPMTPPQMWRAIRRSDATRADFDRAIKQSNIRPEYAPWLWAIRFNYPSLFQLRRLAEAGSLAPARVRTILMYQGYEEQDVEAIVADWTGAHASAAKLLTKAELADEYEGGYIDETQFRSLLTALGYRGEALELEFNLSSARLVKSVRNRTVTALGKLYVKGKLDDAGLRTRLAAAGVSAGAIDRMLPLLTLERDASA